MYGHVAKLAEAEKKGIEEAGGSADVFQYVQPSLYSLSHAQLSGEHDTPCLGACLPTYPRLIITATKPAAA